MDTEKFPEISSFKGFSFSDHLAYRAKLANWRENIIEFWLENLEAEKVVAMSDIPEKDLLEEMEEEHEEMEDSESADRADIEALLDEIQPDDDFGEKIPEKIATTFERLMKKEFNEAELKEFKSNLKIPENSKVLGVPKIPRPLWKQLSGRAREADLKCQYQHQAVSRAMVSTAKLTDFAYSSKAQVPQAFRVAIVKGLIETAKNLSIAAREINNFRRAALKNSFKPEVAGICTAPWEPNEFLIPEDLEKEVKTNRAATSVIKPSINTARFQPYMRRQNSGFTNGRGNYNHSLNYRGHPRSRGGGRGFNRPAPNHHFNHFNQFNHK